MSSKNNILEQEHENSVNNDLFSLTIKEKIEYSHYHKYDGIAPEGFILIPEITLERLKDFEFWKEWKNNPKILVEFSKKDVNNT